MRTRHARLRAIISSTSCGPGSVSCVQRCCRQWGCCSGLRLPAAQAFNPSVPPTSGPDGQAVSPDQLVEDQKACSDTGDKAQRCMLEKGYFLVKDDQATEKQQTLAEIAQKNKEEQEAAIAAEKAKQEKLRREAARKRRKKKKPPTKPRPQTIRRRRLEFSRRQHVAIAVASNHGKVPNRNVDREIRRPPSYL